MEKDYLVSGKIVVDVEFDISSDKSYDEVQKLAKEYVLDYLRLDCEGGMIQSFKIERLSTDLYGDDYEEEKQV